MRYQQLQELLHTKCLANKELFSTLVKMEDAPEASGRVSWKGYLFHGLFNKADNGASKPFFLLSKGKIYTYQQNRSL